MYTSTMVSGGCMHLKGCSHYDIYPQSALSKVGLLLATVPVLPQICTVAQSVVQHSLAITVWQHWYPEYVPDHFQSLINSSLLDHSQSKFYF